MKRTKLNTIVAAAILCVASAAMGADPAAQPIQASKPNSNPAQPQLQVISEATQLIGAQVRNTQGQRLGTIKNLVLDFNNNRLTFCVMSVRHGFLGASKLVAVPFGAFQPSANGAYLILNASKANLARAKAFHRYNWPIGVTSAWGAETGTPPSELPPVVVFAPAAVTPASELVPPQTQVVPPEDPWVADPAWGYPPPPQTAAGQFRTLHYMIEFGYPVMPE